jgi:T5SS/PEP-CTERM-associated repeat protein
VALFAYSSFVSGGITTTGDVSPPTTTTGTVNGDVIVGNTATGALTVDTGSTLTANGLVGANNAAANGTINIIGTSSGAQTTLNLLGPATTSAVDSPLQLGRWGFATMTVSNGAIMNAGLSGGSPSANCLQSNNCNLFIGGAAGATGTLTLTDAGTTGNFAGGLAIGEAFVGSVAHGGFNLGTPGQNASATLQIQNGAVLNSTFTQLGIVPTGFAELGTEQATGHVVVTGTGSVWNISANAVSGAPPNLTIGRDVRGTGIVEVTNNGVLNVTGANSFVTVGNGGTGSLTVSTGGQVSTAGMAVGGQSTGVGTLTIGAGGLVNIGTTALGVANTAGSSGTVLIDGGQLVLGQSFSAIGNLGSGSLTIQNGGQASFSALGLGAQSTGMGVVTVGNGNGQSVLNVSNSLGVGNQGSGQLTINSGGIVNVTGSGGVSIGSATGSNGQVTVNGGQLSALGQNAFFSVGNSGTGTLTVQNGGQLSANLLSLGSNTTGVGTASIIGTGAGNPVQTTVSLAGPSAGSNASNFDIGAQGTGAVNVSNGAVLSYAVGNANCATMFCGTFVGNGAGSTGSLTLTGAGTTVNLATSLVVGNANVVTNPPSNFTFGTPGGTTTGTVQVQNGAVLNSYTATVSTGPNGQNTNGSEHTNAHITVDGAGSTWNITSDPGNPNNAQAFIGTAPRANATAIIDVTNGGRINITGSGSNPQPQINLTGGPAQAGGSSTVNVSGAGSAMVFNGDSGLIQVGRNGGTATLNITSGGQVFGGGANGLTSMNVARMGSQATVNIDGTGSALTLSGVTSAVNGNTPGVGAGITVGRETGSVGAIAVTNGGSLVMRDSGQNATASGVGILFGRDAGASGSLTVSGPGSAVTIEQTGVGSTANPGMTIGNSGSGTVLVTGGGAVTISQGGTGGGGITIASNTGSTGMLTVSGTGSSITVEQTPNATVNPQITVGRGGTGQMAVANGATVSVNGTLERNFIVGNAIGGTAPGGVGTLTVSNGATVSASWFAVGNNSTTDPNGGHGTATIDNATVHIDGITINSVNNAITGGGIRVGRGPGSVGVLNLQNGAHITINTPTTTPEIYLGGTGVSPGGDGTINMSGGSSIAFTGTGATPNVVIGHSGTGSFSMTGGSTLTLPNDGSVVLGATSTGSGTLSVAGGSSIQTGRMNVGQNGSGNVSTVGAALNVAGNLIVGDAGTATFAQSGGTNTIGGQFILGNQTTGNGSYDASHGANIVLTGASSSPRVVVGNQGTGALTVEGSSTLSLPSNGGVVVAATAGATGTVFVTGASSIQAGSFFGIGSDAGGSTGGRASVIVDDPGSSITAGTVTIGAGGCLAGNGVIHGNLVMNGPTANVGACPPSPPPPILPFAAAGRPGITPNGILNAGRSPGRLVIDGGFDFISGTIVLEVESDGHGGFLTDQIVFSDTAPIDLTNANIEFSFLDNTDPNAFEASGLWDLDTFFRINPDTGGNFNPSGDVDISTILLPGQTLDDLFAGADFNAMSSAYVIENFSFTPDGGVGPGFTAVPVPEPPPWMLMLGAMLLLYLAQMRRGAAIPRQR